MKFRTLALALALAFGTTAMVEASTARRPVIHRSTRKSTVRKSRLAKARRAKRGKVVKAHR